MRPFIFVTTFALAACNCGGSGNTDGGTGGGSGGGAGGGSTSRPPTSAFTHAAGPFVALTPIVFDGSGSTDPDGDALTYSWDFGDGRRGGTVKLAHAFPTAGTFTVKLTVADPSGAMASSQQTLTVVAAPVAPNTVPIELTVRTVTGALLDGASIALVGSQTSATTNAQGVATLMIGTQVRQLLRTRKTGYSDQLTPITVPVSLSLGAQTIYLEPRAAALPLDATAGGTVTGTDGVKVTLPANALVDASGAPVSGMVQVSMTPLDVVHHSQAFPGRFEGVRTDASIGLLLSYGTAELVINQGAQTLQLAPGRTADIELPLYADRTPTGAALAAGATVPLWSLDEITGQWTEEGVGTVVTSTAVPSGFAYRATVSHFTWWNSDHLQWPPGRPKPKCCIDGNADGMCDGAGMVEYCWVRGTTNCSSAFGCKAINLIPAYEATALIPGAGGLELPVPPGVPMYFIGYAPGHRGQLAYTGVADLSDEPQLLLTPDLDIPGVVPITVPSSTQGTLTTPFDTPSYEFNGAAGDVVHLSVARAVSTPLEGRFSVEGPGGLQINDVIYGTANRVGRLAVKLPVAGAYRVIVTGTQGLPGTFTLTAATTGPTAWLESVFPANGATGVPVTTVPLVAFSGRVTPASLSNATMTVGNTGSFDITSDAGLISFGHPQPLYAGSLYRLGIAQNLAAAGADGGVGIYGGKLSFSFRTAEALGSPAICGRSFDRAPGTATAGALPTGERVIVGHRGNEYAVYQPGVGWGDGRLLRGTGIGSNALAVAQDRLAYAFTQQKGAASNDFGLYLSRLVDGGFEPATLVVDAGATNGLAFSLGLEANGRTAFAYTTDDHQSVWSALSQTDGGYALKQHDTLATMNFSNRAAVAVGAGRTAVVWAVDTGGNFAVRASIHDGTSWSAMQELKLGADAFSLKAAVDGAGNALAFWYEGGAYEAYVYPASGSSWAHVLAHATAASVNCTDQASLLVPLTSGFMAAGCENAGGQRLWWRTFDVGTATWSPAQVLSASAQTYGFASAGSTAMVYSSTGFQPLSWRVFSAGAWGTAANHTAISVQPLPNVSSTGKVTLYDAVGVEQYCSATQLN